MCVCVYVSCTCVRVCVKENGERKNEGESVEGREALQGMRKVPNLAEENFFILCKRFDCFDFAQ